MKTIIFIAPPAAGKGTQSALLSKEYDLPHISTGDLLRNSNDKEVLETQKQGKLVKTETILKLLKERLLNKDCENGYILDGFPRSKEQAIYYDELLTELKQELPIVIVLDLDKDKAAHRISGRLTCPKCGKVYNSLSNENKPKSDNTCKVCNAKLIKREDDNEETYLNRYDVYEKQTKPLIDYYNKEGILHHIKADNTVNNVFKEIKKLLD